MRYSIIVLFSMLFCLEVFAQQEPQYSQYMYNMSTVNPAYVKGEAGLFSSGILYRNQWQGIEGAPQTANVFGNIPLGQKIELSLNYVNDRIGDAIKINNDFVNVDFAYITNISSTLRLSYGLKVGFNSFKLNALDSDVANDPAFQEKVSKNYMSFGAGAFLFNRNFYAGISSPNLLPNGAELRGISVLQQKLHLYGIFGYIYEASESLKIKPSTVVKQVEGAPITFDVSLNALFQNRFELGASYRYQDAVVALAGFNITQDLKVGYAYDFSIGDLKNNSNGSHEIMLLFNFDLLNLNKKYTSPRFY